jgi:hypothetical protein
MVRGASGLRKVTNMALPGGATPSGCGEERGSSIFDRYRVLANGDGRRDREFSGIFGYRRPPRCVARRPKRADERFFSLVDVCRLVSQRNQHRKVPERFRGPAGFSQRLQQDGSFGSIVGPQDHRAAHPNPAVAASPGRKIGRELMWQRLPAPPLQEPHDLVELDTGGKGSPE